MSSLNCLIRTDASLEEGAGHLMRCRALAEHLLASGWEVNFASLHELEQQEFKSHKLTSSQKDAEETSDLANSTKADFLILDGYKFDASYQSRLNLNSSKLLVIDDHGYCNNHLANIVVNPTPSKLDESGVPKYLQGYEYCLLRNEFLNKRANQLNKIEKVKKVLVCLGGSDKDNFTATIIESLNELGRKDLEVTVILGAFNPNSQSLKDLAQPNIKFKNNISNMAEEITKNDLLIIAGGTLVWEAAVLGTPALAVSIADNQTEVLKKLDGKTLRFLGESAELFKPKLSSLLEESLNSVDSLNILAQSAYKMIDGKGRERIEQEMRNHV